MLDALRHAAPIVLTALALGCATPSAAAAAARPNQQPATAPQAPSPQQAPASAATAPQAPTATAPQPTPAANPSDVGSIDQIVAALYDVISGPPGKKRDWNRMRSLFAPGARMISTGKRKTGEIASRAFDVEGYIAGSGPLLENNGFYEKELARRTEVFGNIAHVFSTYEGKTVAGEPLLHMRGINSIQLMNDGTRWWVLTVFWQAESPELKLPEKYLTTVK